LNFAKTGLLTIMGIRKAVITAAGERQRHLPLQTMVDGQGRNRKVLGLLSDEAASAGIDEIGIVVRPGTAELYRDAVDDVSAEITFIEQLEPRGYGHAVLSAVDYVKDEPFLLMVSDHVYVSDDPNAETCASQLVRIAEEEDCVVSTVQPTHEGRLRNFGTVGGTLFDASRDLYEVNAVLEKPTPTEAEQNLMTPGLRHGYYLTFFGMHVLQPAVMALLDERANALGPNEQLDLSASLHEFSRRGRYLAQVMKGRRYDLDFRHGLLIGQLAVSLSGQYRDEVLSTITDLLARNSQRNAGNESDI